MITACVICLVIKLKAMQSYYLPHSRKCFEDRKSVVTLSPISKVIFSHQVVR